MRNKFSELVANNVAPFHHEPIAPELPGYANDPISRLYNIYWGAATDTHMSTTQDGRRIITGHLVQDPCKWANLMFCTYWGGINWCQSGYCTLGEFLHFHGLEPQLSICNGDQCIELIPVYAGPAQFAVPAAVTTTESKIPQPIKVMGDVVEIQEAFENAHSAKELVDNLNNNKWIAGDKWFMCEGKLGCTYDTPNGLITYIIETSSKKGECIGCEKLKKAMEDEGLGDIKLVKYDKYFRLESDDKKWNALLRNWKDNKINVKEYDEMTPEEWVDHIKWMLATLN